MEAKKPNAKAIINKVKSLLFNYDMSIAYALGEIRLREATMERYEGKQGVAYKKFVVAKVEKERLELYKSELENAKKELNDNLDLITNKYIGKYKQVFISYFIEGKTYQEIADLTNYSFEAIKWIIKRLKKDIIDLFVE